MPRKTAPKTDSTWPLGDYLREHRGKMSIREAARRADISESRWRQLELGYQSMAKDIKVPVQPRPDTLVAMCRAINADPIKALQLVGYDPKQYTHLLEEVEDLGESRRQWFASLPREEREAILSELQRLHVDVEVGGKKGRRAV